MIKDTISDVYPHVLFLAFLVFFFKKGANADINVAKGTVPSPSALTRQSGSILFERMPGGENSNKAIRRN